MSLSKNLGNYYCQSSFGFINFMNEVEPNFEQAKLELFGSFAALCFIATFVDFQINLRLSRINLLSHL